jgi:hypothetical protein
VHVHVHVRERMRPSIKTTLSAFVVRTIIINLFLLYEFEIEFPLIPAICATEGLTGYLYSYGVVSHTILSSSYILLLLQWWDL